MKKILKIIGIYLFLIVVNQSCLNEHDYISDIEFSGATGSNLNNEKNYNYFTKTDVLKNDIIFIIGYKYQSMASLDLGLSEKCYAFSGGQSIDNDILEDTYSLKFDRPFKYKNLIINANQNLFEIDEIKNQIKIYEGLSEGANKVILFSQEFKSESVFTSEDYEVTFNCSTSDNRNFEKKIIVKIEN
ncbi:hypothetical protein [Flavobacterium sp. 5]|uniref:hypothetical protein n=1 Tax=Flavobacterium sp. 5 TaxID=2035199 RepID=UPI000CC4155F|nr:hypothetical protein [Flavobacterium sp. 5]PKB18449.1 hypothetical protein CLU82_3725 [Flavobacterium sp. 5]